MGDSQLKWQAHDATDYDSIMQDRCGKLLNEIVADPARRHVILTQPQDIHRELFASFTPPKCEEYAGTYRGTLGTLLAGREVWSPSTLNPKEHYAFCRADEVPERMRRLLVATGELVDDGKGTADDYKKLVALSYTFCWFGKIHPFLDGNGHIQRATFAAMATEFGYPLSKRFAIHPRPFDSLLAIALEMFTRAPAGAESQELSVVAEYLGFFLDGPFNAPRKHVHAASPYI